MSNSCLCNELAGPGLAIHLRCFGQVWLFEGAPPEAWSAISKNLVRRSLAAGEDLFRQGDPADSMYLIKMGSVKLWKITEEGRVLTLDIRKAGDLLGESVLLEKGEYPVGATCLEPTMTCGIYRESFENLVVKYPMVRAGGDPKPLPPNRAPLREGGGTIRAEFGGPPLRGPG